MPIDHHLPICRLRSPSYEREDGSSVEAQALLDNASSTSFVSERLVQCLSLPRFNQHVRVSGIGGVSHRAPIQSLSNLEISAVGRDK